MDAQRTSRDNIHHDTSAENMMAGDMKKTFKASDLPVVGGSDHFGNADRNAFIIFPNGNFDIFPTETELSIDTGQDRHHFTVELAETIPQQQLGLMFRENLAEEHGMLFDFGLAVDAGLYMKNTFISLDIIFINTDGIIINVAERAVPLSEENIPAGQPIRAALEVPAGTAAALGIGIGDRVLHPIFGTADPAADGDCDDIPPEHGGDTPYDGNDIIHGFTRGEDVIDLRLFGAVKIADFDTNGDGVLGGGDAPVAITAAGDTVIRLPPTSDPAADVYTLTVAGVTGLTAADFLFLA